MNIEILEDELYKIDKKKSAIIRLIIGAVRDYPLFGLNDTNLFFDEIKTLLNTNNITFEAIRNYIYQNTNNEENNIWVISSLSSLLDAFGLMHLYKIEFKDIQNEMEDVKKSKDGFE